MKIYTSQIYYSGLPDPNPQSSDTDNIPNITQQSELSKNLQSHNEETFSCTAQLSSKLEPNTSSFTSVNKLHKTNCSYNLHSKTKANH